MARPLKNNADYFTHDSVMRNHRKVKALRLRFKSDGYAFWCMILELLTESNNFQEVINDQELELISCDFDMPVETLKTLIDYCVKLDLLQLQNGILSCSHLRDRFSGLLDKRQKNQERYIKYKSNTVSAVVNSAETHKNGVSAVENDIVKESKVNQSKVNKSKTENTLSDSGVPSSYAIPPLPEIQAHDEKKEIHPDSLTQDNNSHKSNIDSRFQEFWNAYPRKIGKGQALKIWQRLKVNSELMGKMLQALETQKQSSQWMRDGGQYIPHPGTWLNQGRWDDEVEPAACEDDSPSAELRRAGILPPRPPKLTEEQRAALGLPQE